MTTRILPRSEYPRLAGTELETVWPHLSDRDRVIVVEQDGQIVGCWALLWALHAEGVWIAPDHRGKSAVAKNLLRAMPREAQTMGAKAVTTGGTDPAVWRLLDHLGAMPLPGLHFTLPLETEPCPQQ